MRAVTDILSTHQPAPPGVSPELTAELRAALLAIANDRDKASLVILADYFSPRILSFALNKTGDPQLAMEIVQDTLLAIWKKASTFDEDRGSLVTWIYTIARNLCFDAGRKKRARPQLATADLLYQGLVPEFHHSDDNLISQLDKSKVHQLVALLPDDQRQVVSLIYFNDYSHDGAARQLGIPLGTVKSRLRLALTRLNQLADKETFGYD